MNAADALLSAVVLAVQVGCVLVIASRVTSWWCRDADHSEDSLLRCLVGLTAAIGTVVAVLQVCGMLDILSRGPVLVAHLIVAALVLRFVPAGASPTRPWWWRVQPSVALAVGAFFGALAVILGVTGGPSTEPDTVQYHAPNAGFWLQSHNLWHLPPAMPAFFTNAYPSNGELAGLWLMLPSHSDQLAYGVNVVFGLLAVLAATLIVRELGGPTWAGALAGLAVVLSPLSFQTQTHSMMTDLAGASGVLAGIAFVLVSVRSSQHARWAVAAGVALGIGVGAKDTALAPAIGVVVLLLALAPPAVRLRRAGQVVAGVVAFAGVWWVRAAAATGNPVFPAGLSIGSHQILKRGISPLNKYSTTLADHIVHGRLHPLRVWEGFARSLTGPVLVVAAIGFVVPVVLGLVHRRRAAFLLGGLACACGVAYLMSPYTGGGPTGVGFLIASQLRYALPALLIAAAAGAAVLPRVTVAFAGLAILWDGWKDLQAPGFRTDLHPGAADIGLALLIAGAVVTIAAVRIPSRLPRLALAGLSAAVVAGAVPAYAGSAGPSALDRVLNRSHGAGPVLVVANTDVRSLMGSTFNHQVVSPVDPAHPALSPTLSARALQAAVARTHPSAVVVPADPGPGAVAGFVPPGYTKVGTVGGNTVYVATPAPPPPPPTTVPPAPPTSVPPTTVPPAPPTTLPSPSKP